MKTKVVFVCQSCGSQSPKWQGKCSSCGEWNSLVEENFVSTLDSPRERFVIAQDSVLLSEVDVNEDSRITTGIEELDRVLGGGIVKGSVVLVCGEPGAGKSTISLQALSCLSQKGNKVLYISGEESIKQAKLRANRISPGESKDNFYIVNQTNLNLIIEQINKLSPEVVVIDSIQVLYHPDLSSSPGTVSQVRECAGLLTQLAKATGIALFIVGHVTKEGSLAGPKVLEHMVDTVLYFEGERYSIYRVLRTTKNRFGSTNEIGVFEMTSNGLIEVPNPSAIFLSEKPKHTSGSVVVSTLEGSRSILVEIQALVSKANFGMVSRKTQGIDYNRLSLLVAVLEKKLGMHLGDKDIFVNVAGGVKVIDPAADLGVVISIASAFKDKVIASDTVVLGEVGLSGEVRSISQISMRIAEVSKLGFKRCIIPKNNLSERFSLQHNKLKILPVMTLQEALELL